MTKLQQKNLANKVALLSFDHALLGGFGHGLSLFKSTRGARRLEPGERQYFLQADQLTRSLRALCPPSLVRRSCVMSPNRSWMEVPYDEKKKASLFSWLDMGSCAFPSKYYLYLSCKLRGWWWWDISHRRHDNYLQALKSSRPRGAAHIRRTTD